jgi:hypothetical protein
MSFLGLGSAFWGVVIGSIAYVVLHRSRPPRSKRQSGFGSQRAPQVDRPAGLFAFYGPGWAAFPKCIKNSD